MKSANYELEQFLEKLAREARPGARVPTIREMMRRFGASQVAVQRAIQSLKDAGLIDAQVGRGTYFRAAAAPAPLAASKGAPAGAREAVKSILLLRRSVSITRGRVLLQDLLQRFAADGHAVLEVSYTDPDHARAVLNALPRFDACVVQSTYRSIPINLLVALRDKCEVLAIDGAALIGVDVEAVGTEWGEPLACAVDLLRQRGHQRIAYATTSQPFLATQLGRRRFDYLRGALGGVDLQEITLPLLPDEDYGAALADTIAARRDASGALPFTALVAWGIEDGARFRALLSEAGLDIPRALSVVLLGRTDLVNEHADFFDSFGCSVADQAQCLVDAIQARWADPALPYGVRLTPVRSRAGQSIAAPAGPAPVGARTRPARSPGRGKAQPRPA